MKSLILLEKKPEATNVVENSSGVVSSGTVTNTEVLNPKITGGGTTENYIFGAGGSMNVLARYGLQVLGFATRTFRQPLQVGIPRQSPILFDVGSYRPVMTVSGIVEREARPDNDFTLFEGNRYYTPTFFQLQHAITQWNYVQGQEILLTHLHTNVSSVTYEQYNVAVQNATFGLNAQVPKFWTYEISLVGTRPIAKNASRNV